MEGAQARGWMAGTGRGGFLCPSGLDCNTIPSGPGTWQRLFNIFLQVYTLRQEQLAG